MLDEIARCAQERYGWVRVHVQKDAGREEQRNEKCR
jgi:hypothetical protein